MIKMISLKLLQLKTISNYSFILDNNLKKIDFLKMYEAKEQYKNSILFYVNFLQFLIFWQ